MNILITIVLLVLSIFALQYNAWILFGALVIAAVVASPRAWPYTVATAIGMLLLKYFAFPSWDVLSFLLVGVAYGLMSEYEAKKEKEAAGQIPPELLAYMMMGGMRGAR